MGRGILFLMAGFIIIFGLVEHSVQNHQQTLARRTPDYYYAEQSRNIAFSTMEAALSKFNDGWSPGAGNTVPFKSVLKGKDSVTVDSIKALNSRLFVTIKGTINGVRKHTTTIKAVINRPAFSQYAYFTNSEGNVNFASGDVLYGPVHTNGTFNMDGDPVFNGKVTSPNEPNDRGAYPEYNGGTNFDAYSIKLPSDLSKISNDAAAGGYSFGSDKIKVEFKVKDENGEKKGIADITRYKQNGTKRICVGGQVFYGYCYGGHWETVPTYSSNGTTQNYDLQHSNNFSGIISSKGPVEVKGAVKGNVTVHSQQDIHITGDLTYADFDPTGDYTQNKLNSTDLLGLVSQNDVIVDDNAESHSNSVTEGTTSGSQDLFVTASIMASTGSFTVEDFRDTGIGFRGDLNILGGVIQKDRGPVGLVGNSAGYSKYYVYDKRFQTNSTPDFPQVKRFSVNSWRESTTVENQP